MHSNTLLDSSLRDIKLPPGAILNPTRDQLVAMCQPLGIKPPQEIPREGWFGPVFMTAKPEDLFSMFGGPVVLLEVRPRTKKPVRNGWQALTVEGMIPRYLAGLNSGCNLGVSLGTASRNLPNKEESHIAIRRAALRRRRY